MPPEGADDSYLWDMLQAARTVVELVEEFDFMGYFRDIRTRSAVERQIEIIGEAARYVSAGYREQHPDIPWEKIVGQRHKLAHDYGAIDDEVIWTVATVHIPALILLLDPLVPPAPQDSSSG